MATNVSGEVKLTVTVVLNASFSWLEKPPDIIATTNLATCVCLSLLAVAVMLLNLCVILAICCNSSLKKVTLNQLVAQMSVACFLDCSINVPFSLYFIRTKVWLLGPVFCAFNAASMIFVTLLISWILCYMCLERFFSLVKLCRTARCSLLCKQRIAMATMLVSSSCVIIPVASRLVEVRAFTSRYSCYVATDREVSYRIIVIVSFCVPVIIAMTALICAYVKNFQGIKDINNQRNELSYTELFFEESHLWNEWQTSKFVGAVMLLFIFLELPAIVTFMKPALPSVLDLETATNSSLQVSYPAAQITSSVEKVYFWCRFLFCLAFPLNTLVLRKDIRKKLAIIFSYCRASSFPKSAAESPASPDESPDDFLVPQVWRRRRLSSVTSLKSPIMFGRARSGSVQFMDLTTGIAKWKANYDEPKCTKVDRPFFADIFDDEEELAEFVSFQDFTEEELDSSEVPSVSTSSKDAAVQTARNELLEVHLGRQKCSITAQRPNSRVFDNRNERCLKQRNCRLTKSFTYSRGNYACVNYKYYMTFPKMSSSNNRNDFKDISTSSDLMRALQIKRSRRNNVAVCDLIPRGTDELLESPVESRDIVSL